MLGAGREGSVYEADSARNKLELTTEKEKQEYFRKKLGLSLLGASPLMTQYQVTELCKKFFDYGIEYAEKKQQN